MNTNKVITISSVVIIILLIAVPTIYKVYTKYQKDLYDTVEKKIIEATKKCYYANECVEEKITLQFLYDHNYLEKVSDPVTKEYYNTESYIEIKDNTFKFYVKE